jgi:hypothetical protein
VFVPAGFSAGTCRWQHFVRAAQTGGIECVANAPHGFKVVWCEQFGHKVDLFNANSMLAGDATTQP